MSRIPARFEKVTFEQFYKDQSYTDDIKKAKKIYDGIQHPQRSSIGSAGYDFYLPEKCNIGVGGAAMIPTGIRCVDMPKDIVLTLHARSGLGNKMGIVIKANIGIIDSDYSLSDNEGHIFVKLANTGDADVALDTRTAFCQGVFTQYFIVEDDYTEGIRNGGFGSSDAR